MKWRWTYAVILVVVVVAIAQDFTDTALAQTVSCTVTTASGNIEGIDRGASCAFLGIPYAAPPTGPLRWKPPQPALPWTLFRANTQPSGCSSIQPAGTLAGSEDCLKLNIWVPDPLPSTPAPVIVWLHTGGFVGASANFASHNGQRLAEETGVIVVAPNYRLGAFGFLAHSALAGEDPTYPSSGNYGFLDQRAALTWVRDNIDRFGGDPHNVTLAGTSAGADSVGLHLVSPASAGLFHRAIIESGAPTIRWPTHAEAATQGDAFAAALGCADPAQVLACMRSKTRNEVLLALPMASQQVTDQPGRASWQPVVDGIELPDQPRTLFESRAFNQVPTIIGTNRDEGAGNFLRRSFPAGVTTSQYESWVATEFGASATDVLAMYPAARFPTPEDALARVVGDAQFVCEARRLARAVSETSVRTFLYSFEHEVDDVFPDRVIHGIESNIIFGNNYVPNQFPNHVLDANDLVLHSIMAGYWTRFAATGEPNVDDDSVFHWPLFKDPRGGGRGSNKFVVFGPPVDDGKRPREAQCEFWEPMFLRTLVGPVPASEP